MKVGDLIDYLFSFDNEDEVEIEIIETGTGKLVDSTAAVSISENNLTFGPVLQVDVEAGKFKKFL